MKYAFAMLAAGGAAGAASAADATTVILDWAPTQAIQDISLEGGPAQFYYGFDTSQQKTFLGTNGSALLRQPVFPKPLGGFEGGDFSPGSVKTGMQTTDGPGGSLVYYPKNTGFIDLKFTAHGEAFRGYADIASDATLHSITYSAGVPEPAAWTLMIGGFGLAGAALRQRRRQVPLSA
jgi:hypothetical protein